MQAAFLPARAALWLHRPVVRLVRPRCLSSLPPLTGQCTSLPPLTGLCDGEPSSSLAAEAALLPADSAANFLDSAAGQALEAKAVVQAGILPVEAAMQALDWVHTTTGLPWWATILGCTLAVRTAMVPLAVIAMKNSHRMKGMQPELKALQDEGIGTDTPDGRLRYAQTYKALQDKHGVRLHRTFLPIIGQMPIFITFFFTLTEMGVSYPTMAEGGALWFTDLTLPDATYGLPVLTSLTFLAVVEAGGEAGQQQDGEQAKRMKNVMRGMSLVMIPLTMAQPCSVFVYWITTNLFSMTQTLTLKIPAVKSLFGISSLVPEQSAAQTSAPQHVLQQRAMEEQQTPAAASVAGDEGAATASTAPPKAPKTSQRAVRRKRKRRRR